MKKIAIIFFLSFCLGQNTYVGSINFYYSGTTNGTFQAVLNDTTLSGAVAAVVESDSSSSLFISAIQILDSTTVSALLIYMQTDSSTVTSGEWLLPPNDLFDPNIIFGFFPEVDTSNFSQFTDLIPDSIEFDSTFFVNLMNDLISVVLDNSFLGITGNVLIDYIDSDSLSGSFDVGSLQAGFPPGVISISNGMISMSDAFTILNPMPTPAEVIYPTLQDTFSTHADNDSSITFAWHPSEDIDSNDVIYTLTIELEFFGNTYTDEHENISDTTYDVSSHSLDVLLGALNLDESTLLWYVKSSDGEYNVMSDSGQFVLTRSVLGLNDQFSIPTEFALRQNYPNPFNPVTTLRYDIPENSHVTITIYDMLGRNIKKLINQTQDAGYKSVIWNATNDYGKPVSAGIYLYQIHAGEYMQTKKMVLLK